MLSALSPSAIATLLVIATVARVLVIATVATLLVIATVAAVLLVATVAAVLVIATVAAVLTTPVLVVRAFRLIPASRVVNGGSWRGGGRALTCGLGRLCLARLQRRIGSGLGRGTHHFSGLAR